MQRPLILINLAAVAALSGCVVAGADRPGRQGLTRLAAAGAPEVPTIAATADPLAHEGGIVYLKPLSDITDAAARASAETLGLELATELRARRAMREAALLAEGTVPDATYTLAQVMAAGMPGQPGFGGAAGGEHRGDGDGHGPRVAGPPPPSPWYLDLDSGPGPVPRENLRVAARAQAGSAQAAWDALGADDHARAEAQRTEREMALATRLGKPFASRAGRFVRQGDERTVKLDGGGREIATVYSLPDGGHVHTIEVKRALDERGGLLQSIETLQGQRDRLDVDCERVRTRLPDGAEVESSDAKFTLDGRAVQVRWSRQIGADGGVAGIGRIFRPDGSTIDLASSLDDGGTEIITGADVAGGVSVTVRGGIEAAKARVTLDAGQAGSAILEVTLDAAN